MFGGVIMVDSGGANAAEKYIQPGNIEEQLDPRVIPAKAQNSAPDACFDRASGFEDWPHKESTT